MPRSLAIVADSVPNASGKSSRRPGRLVHQADYQTYRMERFNCVGIIRSERIPSCLIQGATDGRKCLDLG